jgi:mannose-6-phosphate isomerase-like protein (cupin superfamily)/CDGSH-type Zn-finger protein
MNMTCNAVAHPKPCLINVRAGRTYFWCSCGRSATQPFCDGSHKGTSFTPVKFTANATDEEILFCGCKQTRNAPFCDGAHNYLLGGSPSDDPLSVANRDIPEVTTKDGARALLNGCCYVLSTGLASMLNRSGMRYCYLVSADLGALYQTQLLLEATEQPSPIFTLGPGEVILFVGAGRGTVTISERDFAIKASDGVFIRPSEAIQFTAGMGETLKVFALCHPRGDIRWLERMPANFDALHEKRVVSVDVAQRTAMGPRYFQMLVDKRIGCNLIAQFIGHIPLSKAAPHRHLYEETIIVLSGEGYIWTEDRKARVQSGDVIFLPRKQLHSVEATSTDGIDLVGVICPGDNPSINYYD